jgi:hypothetical protein
MSALAITKERKKQSNKIKRFIFLGICLIKQKKLPVC